MKFTTAVVPRLLIAALLSLLPLAAPLAQPAADAAKPIPPVQPQPTTVPGRPDVPNAEVAVERVDHRVDHRWT